MLEPRSSSRHLYAGHHQANKQAPAWLIPRHFGDLGFDATFNLYDASSVVHLRSPSRPTPDA